MTMHLKRYSVWHYSAKDMSSPYPCYYVHLDGEHDRVIVQADSPETNNDLLRLMMALAGDVQPSLWMISQELSYVVARRNGGIIIAGLDERGAESFLMEGLREVVPEEEPVNELVSFASDTW